MTNKTELLTAHWPRIEERLFSATWKEALSHVTLGFTHDLNNVLTGILGLADAMLLEAKPGESTCENLILIKRSAQEAAALIDQLARLHRLQHAAPDYHDLNQLIRQTLDFLRRSLPRQIQVETCLSPGPLPVHVDALELEHAVTNLVFNAAGAMPAGGTLTIHTSRRVDALAAPATGNGRAPLACLDIRDNGQGVAASRISEAFDSPFNLNMEGRFGLGMHQVRHAAQKFGGTVEVESIEGSGTSVRIMLPLVHLNE
jgi:signal transduction histidine kinase